MSDFAVEQALLLRRGREAPELLAHSPGFLEAWREEATRLALDFGDRPPGVVCPAAIFAHAFAERHVAVVHVADQDPDNVGYPTALGYHFLVLPRDAYAHFLGDPFAASDRAPPPWHARGTLPALAWLAQPLPPRTVQDVQNVLQRLKSHALREDQDVPTEAAEPERTPENSEGPALLGGVQVLVDGGKLVFERAKPDTQLLRGLWTLLPTNTRAELWPASFAFGNTLEFDALVVPHVDAEKFSGYTTEDQAADYPESRYELQLQRAAEAGDQSDLDALFGRRSGRQTLRLGLTVLVVVAVLALLGRMLQPPQQTATPIPAETRRVKEAKIVATVVGMSDPLSTPAVLTRARQIWNAPEKEEQ